VLWRASASDLETLRKIEVAAGEAFRNLGMDAVADNEPPTITALQRDLTS